jgi:hypothetical protein
MGEILNFGCWILDFELGRGGEPGPRGLVVLPTIGERERRYILDDAFYRASGEIDVGDRAGDGAGLHVLRLEVSIE